MTNHYTAEEAKKATMEYFDNDELATNVFLEKYALKDNDGNLLEKTPEDMHHRLAKEFARIEKNKFKTPLTEEEIFSYFDKFKYIIPAGSPLFGIGNDFQIVSLSNCYLAAPPLDNYGSILKTDAQLVNISKRRGGVGIDISNLRPSGTITHNAAKTSTGIIPFMERYSNSIREVGQNNRRGALIITINVHHPEIENFITIKNDKTKVTGANISIKLTKEFLNAVENNKEYELRWPIDSDKPKISKMVNAKEIWDKIILNAWTHGEPGLLFWDNIIKETPADCYEEYKSMGTNPCVPSWGKVLTPNSIKEIKDVNVGDSIWSENGWTKITNKWSNGIKKIYEYKTTAGIFNGTEDHYIKSNNTKIKVGLAKNIDRIKGDIVSNVQLNPQDIIDGLIIGDGSKHKCNDNLIILYIGEKDHDYFKSEIKNYILENYNKPICYKVKTTILENELDKTYNRKIPNRFMFGDKNKVCSFLRGLFSANGSICGDRVTLKATSFDVIKSTQIMLSSIGIYSYYTTNKPNKIKFKNGEYANKKNYTLNITYDKEKFSNLIGFIQEYKNYKLKKIIENYKPCKPPKLSFDIYEKTLISEEEVFDITVDNKEHTFWYQGLNISNCSEISLSVLDSCRLTSVNLYSYVKKPFTKEASFDYQLFENHVQKAQRLMDDLVDLESEKINNIIKKIESDPEPINIKNDELEMWKSIKKHNDEGRRTGLGFLALADTLAALNIKYGSDESLKKIDKICKTLKLSAYRSSVDMAKELGSFKIYDYNKEKNNPFINRIKDEDGELYKDMKQYGRRNISLLTVPPTGSISILTKTSSGIEPLFQTSYIRRRKLTEDIKNVKVDFVDQNGDKWQEYEIFHPKVLEWIKITGENNIKKSPWFGACANDVDWLNRIKLQSVVQKHTCHSISSTINQPKNINVAIVSSIYENAWKHGLKGITVYRDGSRSGVLINKEDKDKNEDIKINANKRQKELSCEIYHTNITKKLDKVRHFQYMVLIGMMNGKPYEAFCVENGKCDKKISTGKIIKHSRGNYELILEDGISIKNITKDTTEEEDSLTRMVSLSLRHGIPIQFIVEQLNKVEGDMFCFAKALARSLKKFIKDGTISTELCEKCGAKLVFENGCYTCKNCGMSKCG